MFEFRIASGTVLMIYPDLGLEMIKPFASKIE
ncbi:hypothetical protein M2265_001464 [Sphingobacterium kitahiroshimense]|nr:hypothetical protein [Sphingobacterium kitahiroshimense]